MMVCLLSVSILMLVSWQDAPARPLALADYLQWKTAGSPRISPDGSRIVYSLRYVDAADDKRTGELWIMNADGSNQRPFDKGGNAIWSPTGDRIAYLSSGDDGTRILIRDMSAAEPGKPYPATDEKVSPQAMIWSPDGGKLAFAATVEHANDWVVPLPDAPSGTSWKEGPVIVDDLHFRSGSGRIASGRRHLFVLELSTGNVRQLTRGDWYVGARLSGMLFGAAIDWSPEGQYLYFDGDTNFADTLSNNARSNIYRVTVETGEIERITDQDGFWRTPSVSPNGDYVVYTGRGTSQDAFAAQELRIVDLNSGEVSVLVNDLPDRVYRIRWAYDGSGVFLTQDRAGSTNVEFVSLDGNVRPLTEGRHRLYLANVSRDGTGVASLSTPVSDSNVVAIDMSNGAMSRLTDVNAKLLDDVDLGRVEDIRFEADDGQEIQGWIFYPPDFDPSIDYPLILEVHGGPHYMAGNDFSFRLHEFTTRGYLVLSTNPRGSTGYGAAFANAINNGFPGAIDSGDLMAGVDYVVDRGIVDESRIYAMGCSGGGSLVAWLTSHSKRFAAVAMSCAVTNWVSMAGTTDVAAWTYTRFQQPFWDDPEPWLESSPLMHVGKVSTPTLIMVGGRDGRTPVSQSAEYYVALKVRQVPSRLLIFENEGHGPWRGAPSNLFRTQEYIDDWFSTYARTDR